MNERDHAIREGEMIGAEDAYFSARIGMDTENGKECFRAGFKWAWRVLTAPVNPEGTIVVAAPAKSDAVNHPPHYTQHPSGIECIQITEHMGFNLGNAVKYVWRADLKSDAIEDLKKARWYIDRELKKRGSA